MKKENLYVFLIYLLMPLMVNAQYDPNHPPNTYRSNDNPLYWQNDPPEEGYWQQDVYYKIKAEIDEQSWIIDGSEELTYWNNSPDTLTFVYFRLIQNAFQPSSYYHKLNEENDIPVFFGMYEKMGLGTVIEKIKVNGEQPHTILRNTVLKVYLNEPLPPGEKVQIDIKFKTFFDNGSMRRRMKVFKSWGYWHFDGVHWYPRLAVYDRKFGWVTDQHMDKEFYGNFGTYDVELTFANNYIVEATGNLLNREEVLPDDLRQKLDIKNFADKPWGEKPSVIIEYDTSKHKTWHYYAENVHDFAFTADPSYRIGEAEWDGIKTVAVVQEPHASKWQNAAGYAAKIIKTFSEDFGRYEYPKMVVADARDGMEYPMLTLDSGKDPTYRGLLVHEIGHNWFFGMLGTNETYRASMDEGFTQFLTAWGLNKLDGKYMPNVEPKSWYKKAFHEPARVRDARVYYGYLSDAIRKQDAQLATHSSDFGGGVRHGGGYRHVYYKMGTMLFNLQYVLGDSLFQQAMRHYVNQWKIAHPYFEDFKNSVIQYTDVDLNWFFDQWWMTTKRIDYAIGDVEKSKGEDEYVIEFERKGEMQMPVDFRVISRTGEIHDFHIPNGWFIKETDATVLPMWYGFGNLQPEFEVSVTIPGGVKEVIIDPSDRLADVYRLDNRKVFWTILKEPVAVTEGWTNWKFDSELRSMPDLKAYEVRWRPDVWYNAYDGIKAGLHLEGDYMNYKHIFSFTGWFNTGALQGGVSGTDFDPFEDDHDMFSYIMSYQNGTEYFLPGSRVKAGARILDGLNMTTLAFEKDAGDKNTFWFGMKVMNRFEATDLLYPLYPSLWQQDKYNNSFNAGLEHRYRYKKGNGDIDLSVRSSSLWSDYSYSYLALSVVNRTRLGKFLLNTRTFARWGTGSDLPGESALYLAGASPEQLMENKFTRARGFIPEDWLGYGATTNHFHHGGGLNLRAYSGYLVAENTDAGVQDSLFSSHSGASINLELEFDDLIRIRPRFLRNYKLDTYIFTDIGSMIYQDEDFNYDFSTIRADAGIGAAFTIQKFWQLETVNPLTIRFDVPLYLSHIPAAECAGCGSDPSISEAFKFRWVIGVNRAF